MRFIWLTLLVLLGINSGTGYAQDRMVADPRTAGMSSEKLAAIGTLGRSAVDRGELPGVITFVARQGRVVHFECSGSRDLEEQLPMTADTIFRIYSMTKPITTVAALVLLDDGRLELDTPVSKYIPALADMRVYGPTAPDPSGWSTVRRGMTVRDLLTHTSGLTYGYSTTHPVDRLYNEVNILDRRGTTLEVMIRKLSKLPLRYQPGERWHYGLSTDVLGYLIQVVSGQALDQFCRERIFLPLRMPDSGFAIGPEQAARFAEIYSRSDGKLVPWGGSWETEAYVAPVSFFSGGGGGVSTVVDYFRFLQMLLNGGQLDGSRILSEDSVRLMTTDQLGKEISPGWGFGFGVRVCVDPARSELPASQGSFGWGGGGNTFFFVDPEKQLVAMVWTQLSGASRIRHQFRKAVYEAILD